MTSTNHSAPIVRELFRATSRQLIEAQGNLAAAQRLIDQTRTVLRRSGIEPSTTAMDAALGLAMQATEQTITLMQCALDSQIMGLHESGTARGLFDDIVGRLAD